MKKITIVLVLSLISLASFGQWNPKPNNSYKWYRVIKDTTIKDIEMTGFDVCIYQWAGSYVDFNVDSVGNMLSSPFKSTIWFMEFANAKNKLIVNRESNLKNFAADFNFLPFAVEDGTIGISQSVNVFLTAKYNVSIENIVE